MDSFSRRVFMILLCLAFNNVCVDSILSGNVSKNSPTNFLIGNTLYNN